MKNDLNLTSIVDAFTNIKNFIVRYRFVIFILIISLILGFMFIRISKMSTAKPTSEQIAEAKASIQVIKIDEDDIEAIKILEDRNINIEALFESGRYDPFND